MATVNAIEIPPVWTNLNTLTGIAVGSKMYLQNVGRPGDIISLWQGETEPSATDRGWSVDQIKDYYVVPPDGPTVWVKYYRMDPNEDLFSKTALLQVSETKPVLPMRFTAPTSPAEYAFDYPLEVSKGNIPGSSILTLFGRNTVIQTGATETVWDYGGSYEYLTADTQLYLSSTSASDTAVVIVVQGLDSDYNEVQYVATLNGQSQVALSGLMFRVHNVFTSPASPATPLGDVYLAESDTLTGGEPDTPSKVKSMIRLARDTNEAIIDSGTDFASDNFSHNGFYTVPAGKTAYAYYAVVFIGKNDDVAFSGRIRLQPGGVWWNRSPSELYQNAPVQEFQTRLGIPEKTDLEWRVIAGSPNSAINFQLQLILVDNDV